MFKNSNFNTLNKHQVTVISLFRCFALNAVHPNNISFFQSIFFPIQNFGFLLLSVLLFVLACFLLSFLLSFPLLAVTEERKTELTLSG